MRKKEKQTRCGLPTARYRWTRDQGPDLEGRKEWRWDGKRSVASIVPELGSARNAGPREGGRRRLGTVTKQPEQRASPTGCDELEPCQDSRPFSAHSRPGWDAIKYAPAFDYQLRLMGCESNKIRQYC